MSVTDKKNFGLRRDQQFFDLLNYVIVEQSYRFLVELILDG